MKVPYLKRLVYRRAYGGRLNRVQRWLADYYFTHHYKI